MLAREGIVALRRAKRRNMERYVQGRVSVAHIVTQSQPRLHCFVLEHVNSENFKGDSV